MCLKFQPRLSYRLSPKEEQMYYFPRSIEAFNCCNNNDDDDDDDDDNNDNDNDNNKEKFELSPINSIIRDKKIFRLELYIFSKIQLVVYYQCLIAGASTSLYLITH